MKDGEGEEGEGRDAEVLVRPLHGMEDWILAGDLQEAIWGPGFSEKAPPSLLMVASRLGGIVAGAFLPDGRMVGFVFGLTGVEDGRVVHWSDMLGVSPEARNRGLGLRLKRYQRQRLVDQGVTRVYWSYDPLESRNGWLNLRRLGAVASEYVVDMYGASSSPLHRGMGTDRFVVHWELTSARVRGLLDGDPDGSVKEAACQEDSVSELPSMLPWRDTGNGPVPLSDRESGVGAVETAAGDAGWLDHCPGGFRVAVPTDIQALRNRDPGAAAGWRQATRKVLRPALSAGWQVLDLVRQGPVSEYVVRPPSSGG